MAASTGASTRARQNIPASIILPQCELKHYRRWQRLYTSLTPAEQGYIPSAEEYAEFQQWRKKQDSGYFSDVFEDISNHIKPTYLNASSPQCKLPIAALCHHAMHPITALQARPRCPVCTVDMYLTFVKVISQALVAAGGRAPSCTLTASEHQDTIYSAWCREKISLLKELSELQVMADDEANWSVEHPETSLHDANTATKALELYWFESNGFEEVKSTTKKEKRVRFTDDTDFQPRRPQAYYWKRSPRYEPGEYATVELQDQAEDAVSEDSEDYTEIVDLHTTTSEISRNGEPLSEVKAIPHSEHCSGDLEEDDGDIDWEDVESDDENSELWNEVDDRDYIFFEIAEETNFVVFADD